MRYYFGLSDVAELVKTRYANFLTGLTVNQFQTELVKIASKRTVHCCSLSFLCVRVFVWVFIFLLFN